MSPMPIRRSATTTQNDIQLPGSISGSSVSSSLPRKLEVRQERGLFGERLDMSATSSSRVRRWSQANEQFIVVVVYRTQAPGATRAIWQAPKQWREPSQSNRKSWSRPSRLDLFYCFHARLFEAEEAHAMHRSLSHSDGFIRVRGKRSTSKVELH